MLDANMTARCIVCSSGWQSHDAAVDSGAKTTFGDDDEEEDRDNDDGDDDEQRLRTTCGRSQNATVID